MTARFKMLVYCWHYRLAETSAKPTICEPRHLPHMNIQAPWIHHTIEPLTGFVGVKLEIFYATITYYLSYFYNQEMVAVRMAAYLFSEYGKNTYVVQGNSATFRLPWTWRGYSFNMLFSSGS